MVLKAFFYVATIFMTHHVVAFIQAFFHCRLGHNKIGRSLYKTHLYNHHGIYSGEIMVSQKYLDEAQSLDIYYVIPAVFVVFSARLMLPFDLFIVHIVSFALSTWAHLYLHTRYHLSDCRLKRFNWFRRKQRLHLVHHKNMTKNFAVIEFCWDKALGTYTGAPIGSNG